jgi:hypothetical protein
MSSFRVAFLSVGRLNAVCLLAMCALALLGPRQVRAEGDADAKVWVSRALKCDGFDDNRCYRFVDRRRRGKPYLEPRRYPIATREYARHYNTYYERRRHYDKYRYGRYGRSYHEPDDDNGRYAKYEDRQYYGRSRYGRARYGRSDHYYGRHDSRYERQCLHVVTAKGSEAQTENGALISAKRAWRAWVRSDYGERYQDLDHAKRGEYRCWRSSTNESALGRAGEFITGQYRKRCQVWAVPCLGERQKLEGDKDDRE